jgi:mono/diheme cytochrome c family protein
MRRSYNIVIYLFAWILFPASVKAQDWIVPPGVTKALSPFVFTEETMKSGQGIYMANCRSCHGDPGKGNFITLNPPPPDPGREKMQKNSDGEIFFKIREGHGAMPSFKNILPVSSIWNVISFIRSFNPEYKQQVAPKMAMEGITKISLTTSKEKNKIETILTNENNKVIKPVSGEEIQLFAVRYFGNLPVDKIKTTDKKGAAVFDFPENIPGDSLGKVRIIARLADETKYGEVKADTFLKIGVATWKPALNEKRAMWNVNHKAPLWLLISYFTVLLSIWGFIFYVIYLLRRIYIAGKGEN